MSALTPEQLLNRSHELYRESPRGHWQRRIQTLASEWLGSPVILCWTVEEEADAQVLSKIPIADRAHPPQWLGLTAPLTGADVLVTSILADHIGCVADLMDQRATPDNMQIPKRWVQLLTARQIQACTIAASGQTNQAISEELGIAPRTVARLLQEAYRRLGINSRAELAVECALDRPPTPIHMRGDDKVPVEDDSDTTQ